MMKITEILLLRLHQKTYIMDYDFFLRHIIALYKNYLSSCLRTRLD